MADHHMDGVKGPMGALQSVRAAQPRVPFHQKLILPAINPQSMLGMTIGASLL